MNNASASRPLILVTIGPPGGGKSFFARQFTETFGAPLISFDEIRYELFNDVTYTPDEDIIVARVAGLQLRELMKTKKTILIDGGHNPKVSRVELAKVARANGYGVMNIWVQTDERTARVRSTRRGRGKHDQFNRALSDAEFESQAKKFTPPSKFEPYVVISGRHTYNSQARIVLKKMIPENETTTETKPATTATDPGRRSISIN